MKDCRASSAIDTKNGQAQGFRMYADESQFSFARDSVKTILLSSGISISRLDFSASLQ